MTQAIQEVTKYIEGKCNSISRGRMHTGARLINLMRPYSVDMSALTVRAVSAASLCYQKSRRKSDAPFKLTVTSTSIGLSVISHMGVFNTNYQELLSVGDLYLEALLQLGFIQIEREYDGYRAPYIIKLTDRWIEIGDLPPEYEKHTLMGTSFVKPKPINGLRNEFTKRPYIKRMSSERDFQQLLDRPFVKALDKLQSTAWKINIPIAKALETNIHKFLDLEDTSMKSRSKAIEMKFVLSKVHAINDNKFYQMVECDYRGRIYYTESFFNFQGSDIAKGLFLFEDGKPLDDKGYQWLCIHTACSYNQSYNIEDLPEWLTTDYRIYLQDEGLTTISVDKMTLKDRELWTLNNLTWITQLADGEEFRMEAEKPVSFLAACTEIRNYLNCNDTYMCHLPIPVDGSNNGWQHLAAMSKDKQAGDLVSLVPNDIQKDFYVQVAKRLIERLPEWFDERKMPMKAIRKGIAKRGSMTRAYSAGQKKIAINMYHDCKVEGYTEKYNITEDDCKILAKNLILAINDTCVGPLKTMKFIQKITDYLLNQGETCTKWETPSGFPVLYEVWRQKNICVRSSIYGLGQIGHSIKIPMITQNGDMMPCRRSFASGCSPNFVHSMDAAHMAKVIDSFPGDFGAIHDSFSTHACDVDKLLDHTKWQFAMMYNKQNFFNNIETMMLTTRKDYDVKQPILGELDISEIISSDYFFC